MNTIEEYVKALSEKIKNQRKAIIELTKILQRYHDALKLYANEDNWSQIGSNDEPYIWMDDDPPWKIAQRALHPKEDN